MYFYKTQAFYIDPITNGIQFSLSTTFSYREGNLFCSNLVCHQINLDTII